jgi:hypothetical protein
LENVKRNLMKYMELMTTTHSKYDTARHAKRKRARLEARVAAKAAAAAKAVAAGLSPVQSSQEPSVATIKAGDIVVDEELCARVADDDEVLDGVEVLLPCGVEVDVPCRKCGNFFEIIDVGIESVFVCPFCETKAMI